MLTIYTVEIQYAFTNAPTNHIPLLGDFLSKAVQTSNQWEKERRLGLPTTECLTTLIPEGENMDISITLWVGRREAVLIHDLFKLQRTWVSSSPSHLLPQPHTQQEQDAIHPVQCL